MATAFRTVLRGYEPAQVDAEVAGQPGQRDAERCGGVGQPRAVEVHLEALVVSERDQRLHFGVSRQQIGKNR